MARPGSGYRQQSISRGVTRDRRDRDDTAQTTPAPVSISEQARHALNTAPPLDQVQQPELDPTIVKEQPGL
jgi:hypothetical protein